MRDIQLRVKGASPEALDAEVARAAQACRDSAAGAGGGGGRLWVNDFWRAAVKHGAYGVHLGQEDLEAGGGEALSAISKAGLRLGLSTHSYLELARATAVRPSYISLGPVFETTSKKVAFSPRGAVLVGAWRALVDVPLIAIGGISLERAPEVCVTRGGWIDGRGDGANVALMFFYVVVATRPLVLCFCVCFADQCAWPKASES